MELGTLRIEIKRTATELWVQPRRDTSGAAEWLRWPAPPDARIEVHPAPPERLLVVSHEHSYHLPPQGEARVYVRIPLFVQVVIAGGEEALVVADVPSIVLSDTWWGTFTEGELAYWLTTKARVALSDDLFMPHLAMCPVRLLNESEEALPVDRFAVRAPHLSLYGDGGRHWTDEVTVRYENAPEGSEIRFGSRPPAESHGAQLMAPPRDPPGRGFHAKTFDRLRSLSSLGL